MNKIFRPHSVEREILAIAEYIGQNNLTAALGFLDAVESAAQLLADMPEIGGSFESDHPRLQDLRVWSIRGFEGYLIYYRPIADGIQLVHVAHGSREIERHL